MPRPVASPPQKHAWDGAQFASRNADYHRACAEALAAHELHGAAVSHLVLATEEAIKSLSFLMTAIGLPLPPEDARKLLTNHKTRHAIAGLSQIVIDFVAKSPAPQIVVAEGEVPEADLILTVMQDMVAGWGHYAAGPHDSGFERDLLWWQVADAQKQAGMYVDYAPQGWTTPTEVSKADYEATAGSVARFFEVFDKQMRPWMEASPDVRQALLLWFEPIAKSLQDGGAEQLWQRLVSSASTT
ncbi:MAG TPA: hypothetical protein VFQ76_18155 [Longimicrobiaceae bacterium]|nr:hypothetical protein [Longimicrobiaceae bacterium]